MFINKHQKKSKDDSSEIRRHRNEYVEEQIKNRGS